MPQSVALKAQFEQQIRPQLRLAYQRLFERLGPSTPQVEASFLAFFKEMKETAIAENAAVQVPTPRELSRELTRIIDGESPLQPVVDALVGELDAAMAGARLQLEVEFYVAAFPTGSFNAMARATEPGVLILVNSGLMMMAHQVSKIVAFAMRFHDETPDGVIVEHPQMGQPTHTLEEIRTALVEVFVAYALFDNPTYARRFPALGGVRGLAASGVRDAIELFAVAHELGHVLAGHLDESHRSTAGELAADDFALRLLLHHPAINDPAARMFIAAGPLVFFTLAEILDEIAARVAGPPRPELVMHPRSDERLAMCRGTLGASLGVPVLELADTIVQWLDDHSALVVEVTVEAVTKAESSDGGAS